MERDPSFKQLIPYVIFRYRDPHGAVSLFQYTRGRGQGEARLHQKRSIGVGGHICAEDHAGRTSRHPYEEGLRRELDEEVVLDTRYEARLVGLINDDETEVGRVHLGLVHLFDVDAPSVVPREAELVDSGFRPVHELLRERSRFESWSQICLDAMFGPE
jgi:predicted NUDIX family phosphoesterase